MCTAWHALHNQFQEGLTAINQTFLTPLIGRERDVAELSRALIAGRLVSAIGPGGAGKTRLARELVVRAEREKAAATFVDLSGAVNASEAATRIAAAIDAHETSDLDAAGAIIGIIDSSAGLLALDNVEQIPDIAVLVQRLLTGAPGLTILATSRAPIGVQGEHEVAIGALDLPADETPQELERAPATALFLARARAIGRLATVTDAEAQAVARLVRTLDGLPLAIELAAARTRIFPPATILRRLEAFEPVLSAASGDPRHRSLKAVLDWSLELLSDKQRELLLALSVCVGSFDVSAAEALSPGTDVVAALDALVAHSLVMVLPDVVGEPRFRLLSTVRQVLVPRLQSADLERAHDQHARHVDAFVATLAATWRSPARIDNLARVDAEIDNIRAALRWSERRSPKTFVSLAVNLQLYWNDRSAWREALDVLTRAVSLADDAVHKGATLVALLEAERHLHGFVSEVRAREVVEIGEALGDPSLEGRGLTELVMAWLATGLEWAPSVDAAVERITLLALGTTDHNLERRALFLPGAVAQSRLDARGPGHYMRSIDAARRHGDRGWEGQELGNLAQMHALLGNYEASVDAAEAAVASLRALGSTSDLASILAVLASGCAKMGRDSAASGYLSEAAELAEGLADPGVTMDVLGAGIALLSAVGAGEQAAALLGAAEAADARGRVPPDVALVPVDARGSARVRKLMTPTAFGLAVRAGSELDLDSALIILRAWLANRVPEPASRRPRGRNVSLIHGELTAREIEILAQLALGRRDTEIAQELFISAKTVSVHISNAKEKLGAASRLDLALRAREMGLGPDP